MVELSKKHSISARIKPNRSPAERVRFGKEEGANIVQFSPQGGNGMVFALRGGTKSKPSGAGSIWKGRRSEHSAVFAARRKRNGVCSQRKPNRSPAKRVRFGKEEGANIVQFSPQGGNGTVFAPSDVVPVTGIEPVRLSSRDFKSRASANSATPAWWYTLIKYHSAPVLSRQSILDPAAA